MSDLSLDKDIIEDKLKGLSDEAIGIKYNVNLKFIEKSIVKNLGINVSNPANIESNTYSNKIVKKLFPKDFNLEPNTVWSFKSRGTWATHSGNYRGNWSPYIPRNIILKYSKEKDLVLDYFCGSGTTAVESKLLNRNFIGIDINENAIKLSNENTNFNFLYKTTKGADEDECFFAQQSEQSCQSPEILIDLKIGDARDLYFVNDNSVDLICSHPPYSNIVHYTHDNINDLSNYEVNDFLAEIEKVADESYRTLKDGKYCSILIGDMRKNKNVIPLGFKTIDKYLRAGFLLKELIIKRQHNCKTTGFWYTNSIKYNFLLLAHEYLAVFKKSEKNVNIDKDETKKLFHNTFLKNGDANKIKFIKNDDIRQESTTVWIFEKENWIDNVLNNLIKRYGKGNGLTHSISEPASEASNYIIYNNQKKQSSNAEAQAEQCDLLIYFYDNNFNDFNNNFDNYLKKEGILAIVCEDIRLDNGIIYSSPIHIEKYFNENQKIKIKEIVVIQIKNLNNLSGKNENLNINHKYLMIYKMA